MADVSSPTAGERVERADDVDLREASAAVAVPSHPGSVSHEVTLVDGRFMHAECSCGWRSAGRRNRATVRAEARDHALLHAGTDL